MTPERTRWIGPQQRSFVTAVSWPYHYSKNPNLASSTVLFICHCETVSHPVMSPGAEGRRRYIYPRG